MAEPKQIGRYVILEELGRGGMGRVMRADDPTIRRQVAIKVIRLDGGPTGAEQELFERSFLREIRAAGALQHPGIVSIYDAGRQNDLAYIVMELVDGVTFEAMLRSTPRPELPAVLAICRQVASALDYAHGNGIFHRDIKPANILIAGNGAARIADFGIAKTSRNGIISFGKTILAAGTPDFMSPEQIKGESLDGRTDQWSLAVIVYFALTGARPFPAEQMTAALGQIMSVDPPPPCRVNPSLPAAVDAVMGKALAKDPALRFGSCTEFIDAVETALATAAVQPEPAPAPGWGKKPGTSLIAAALGVILAMVAVAIFVLRHDDKPAPPASVPSTASAAPAGIGKPAPGVSAARKAQMSQESAPAETAPAAEPAKAGGPGETRQVRLITDPPEADVTVDGKRQAACKSPCMADLPDGVHTLMAKKEGYRATLQNFQVSGDGEEVSVTLNPVTGSLQLQTDPAGAAIAIDGNARAEVTPVTLALPVGKYRVRLSHAGYATYEFEAVVLPESMREISVRLAK
jgi:serine/threonine-protein kinase